MDQNIIILREKTGAGVMECKRALTEAQGNMDKAIEIIHAQGLAKAETKKDRKTGAGILKTYIHNERIGVLVEIRCETDFVVKSDPFQALATNVAMHIAAVGPETVEELLKQLYVRDESITVEELVKSTTGVTGENIKIERFARFEL
jgi:elongation factor Ts